jgi:hypothetical protein
MRSIGIVHALLTHRSRSTTGSGSVARITRLIACAAVTASVALSAAGCNKPLFPENSARTQFETYDRLRQQSTPLEEEDEFGQKRPALRARLAPQN